MKDRKPVGAFLGSMFIVGVQAIVYILVYNESYYSVLDGSLAAGVVGILPLLFGVVLRANRKDKLSRILTVPMSFFGVIPRALQDVLWMADNALPNTVRWGGLFVAVLLYTAFLMMVCDREELKKLHQERAANKERGYSLAVAEKFYDECVRNKITDLSRDADRQRLKLLAENNPKFNLPGVNPEAMFQTGKECKEQAKQAEQEKKQADMLTAELEREAEEKKMAEMPPREKRIYQLEKIAKAANDDAKAMSRAVSSSIALSQSLQTKEKDPSVYAGIASGIGGVVPAAMTASRIGRENQKIRARNAAVGAQFSPLTEELNDAWGKASTYARKCEQKAEDAKLKLADGSRPAEELFAALSIGQPQTSQTETGAVIVSLKASSGQSYEFSGVRAVVDGAILADVCSQRGETVGLAHICLPADGLRDKEEELSGICTATRAGESYTVKLRPGNLFLIEA